MPLRLSDEPLLHRPVLEGLDEIPISIACGTAASSPRARRTGIDVAICWWRVVGRAWLQSDGCIWVQMARHALDRLWDAALLLIQS